jgi:hypothetical protein
MGRQRCSGECDRRVSSARDRGQALVCDTPVIVRDVGELASVTANLFTTDAEFVDLVCGFEDLPLDDSRPFSMAALKEQYISFFTQFV